MASDASATEARKIFAAAMAGRADIDVADRVLWSPIFAAPAGTDSYGSDADLPAFLDRMPVTIPGTLPMHWCEQFLRADWLSIDCWVNNKANNRQRILTAESGNRHKCSGRIRVHNWQVMMRSVGSVEPRPRRWWQ